MITKDKMIALSREKEYAMDINNSELLKEANSKLYRFKRQYVERAKVNVKEDNLYRKYLDENREYIKARYALNITVETTEEAIKVLQEKVDMRALFGIDVQYMEIFQSDIFFKEEYYEGLEGSQEVAELSMARAINSVNGFMNIDYAIEENTALGMWIYRVSIYKEGLQAYIAYDRGLKQERYYLKDITKDDAYSYSMYFNSIEIYEICNKCNNQYSAIKELCSLLNIKVEFEAKQKNKYESNLRILQEEDILESQYPILFDCLKYHSDFLKFVNKEGRENINYSYNSYCGENIFAFSNEFIGNKAVNKGDINKQFKYSKGTVNPKITLFCVLGLLRKVPLEELPKRNRFRAYMYGNEENSYIVPLYTEQVLAEAEERVRQLKENKVKPTKINGEICKDIFGDEIYKNVYGNYYKLGA